jgi:group I intron endonuclease
MMKFVVYCHTCKTNGKAYVGFTSLTLEQRWQQHCFDALCRNSQLVFHRAIRKHSVDAWDHEILDVLTTEKGAKHAEELWVEQRKTYVGDNRGYNSTRGGDGTIGYVFTVEQRKKVGDAVRKHFSDPVARQKKIDSCNRPEVRMKNSAAQKLAQNRPEVKAKKSVSLKVAMNALVTKKKMCESSQRRWSDPEERRKNCERLNNPDIKEKISRATRRSVDQYTLEGNLIARFKSLTEAAIITRINVNSICQCCRGNRLCNNAGGFHKNTIFTSEKVEKSDAGLGQIWDLYIRYGGAKLCHQLHPIRYNLSSQGKLAHP